MLAYGPVKLRPIEERDQELLRELLNDPDISSSTVDYGFPVSSAQQAAWFRERYPMENSCRFMVEAEGATIGTIVFAKYDEENQTGEIGCKILRAYQGKNYSVCADYALFEYLFEVKGVECIEITHVHTNTTSKRIMEKIGLTYEGIHRKARYKNGGRLSLVCWSIAREEFEQLRKELDGFEHQG